MKIATGVVIASLLLTGACLAGESVPVTEKEKTNYSVGYQVGGDFKRQGIDLETDQLVQGIRDAVEGVAPKVPAGEMQKSLAILKSRITAAEQQRKNAQYEADLKAGRAFLAENGKKEGVVTLADGLQYKMLREGSGDSPGPLDNVVLHYSGRHIDGTEFYTTRNAEAPAPILVGNLLPGMREAVQKMKPGGRVVAFIPAELGYAGGHPLYGKTVIFEIDLVKVEPKR